jgi:predicted nucleotidyltransferase
MRESSARFPATADRDLIERALTMARAPRDAPVVFEGSLAEGFGNATSDLDLLVVTRDDDDRLSMPSVIFIEGRRLEVRFRTSAKILGQAKLLRSAKDPSRLSEEALDEWHRFSNGRIIRHEARVTALREALAPQEFRAIVARWQRARAINCIGCSLAFAKLGNRELASAWARKAVLFAAKTWVAERGETYLEEKWIELQLARVNAPAGLQRDVVNCLLSVIDPPWELCQRLGIPVEQLGARPFELSVPRDVTTWQIGDVVHIVKNRTSIYRLDPSVAPIWRGLVQGVSLDAVLTQSGPPAPLALQLLWHYGLIDLSSRVPECGRLQRPSWRAREPTPPLLRVSLDGLEGTNGIIGPSPLGAREVVSAGLAFLWENTLVENAIEDGAGAIDAGQTGVVSTSIERVLVHSVKALLSSYCTTPLPDDAEAFYALDAIGLSDAARADIRTRVDDIYGLVGRGNWDTAWHSTVAFAQEMRVLAGGRDFPRSFASNGEWQRTLEVGYDWIRLGAFLNAKFPTRDSQQLLASS